MEAPTGLEPVNHGFANRSLSHLGTAPLQGLKSCDQAAASMPN